MSAELLARARAGDGDAFRQLTDPHRRELQVHRYRVLGSIHDAEDALQETLLAAWQGLGGFEERASLRTWLYRVATHRCLNALRSASRRPRMDWSVRDVERWSRHASARSFGSSRALTSCSKACPSSRLVRRHATRPAKRSHSPS